MDQAKRAVYEYVDRVRDKSDPKVEFGVYIVWFCKTLQNWKALVSTTLPDGKYYEVTFNGDADEMYLDVYVKTDNLIAWKSKE